MKHYHENLEQIQRLAKHPRVTGRFLVEKGLWNGRKVAVRVLMSRGDSRHRTQIAYYYAVLDLTAGRDDQFGLVLNGETQLIHKNRALGVFDLTRTKP